MNRETRIVVRFPVKGSKIPSDHGYGLYSAISQIKPEIHGLEDENRWFGLELISGIPFEKGLVSLPSRGGSLRLRIPADRFGDVLDLAGKKLDIGGHIIQLGVPTAYPLRSSDLLYSRIVTFKNSETVEKFLETAKRELLEALEIDAPIEIPKEAYARHRRIITIKGKKVVGFSLIVKGLSEDDSLKLQSIGLGGRRAMGCGVFNPIAKPSSFEGE
ncbi:MAG: type I-MYXAN CRISPR-associated protein Cas6/Cmx6 [Pyrinomonadaceae bacterium]